MFVLARRCACVCDIERCVKHSSEVARQWYKATVVLECLWMWPLEHCSPRGFSTETSDWNASLDAPRHKLDNVLHHILFFLLPITWNSSGSKRATKNHSRFQALVFKMFYFSITSTPLKGFCSRLNWRLFSPSLWQRQLNVLCRSVVCDLAKMSRTWMTFHGRAPCTEVPWSWLASHQERVLILSGESTRRLSCGKVNQCDYWLEVIKWLISATFSWRREILEKELWILKEGERRGGGTCKQQIDSTQR